MSIGIKIRKLRELKGWTADDLADKLGMSAGGLGKLERGESDIPFSRLEQVAKVFGMKVEELVSFDERMVFQNFGTASDQSFSVNYLTVTEKQQELHEKTLKLVEQVTSLLEKLNNKS